jgi:hypothetical protein
MSSVLRSGAVGFVLGFCLIVYIATLVLAIGSLVFQMQSYDDSCNIPGECFAVIILIPFVLMSLLLADCH